jgi:hypothetical protein
MKIDTYLVIGIVCCMGVYRVIRNPVHNSKSVVAKLFVDLVGMIGFFYYKIVHTVSHMCADPLFVDMSHILLYCSVNM